MFDMQKLYGLPLSPCCDRASHATSDAEKIGIRFLFLLLCHTFECRSL